MDIKINDLSLSEKEIEVTASYDEIKKDIESEVLKQTKKIQIPGFRKGKVPLTVLKRMYGDALEYEASEKVANTKFWDLAKEKDLHPIGQPQMTDIKFNPGENLSFKVKYEVIPELEVKDYKGIDIEVPEFITKDAEIDAEINYIKNANRIQEETDIIGEDNNYLIDADFTRTDEKGETFPGSAPESLQVDFTSERVQPEIVKNAKGKKAGETFSFSFTDEHTHKNEKGEEEVHKETFYYNALIKSIKKIVIPELNEELIKKATKDKVSTEPELREQIKNDIQGYYDQRTEDFTKDKLLSEIVKRNDFVPPSTFVNNILEDLVKREEEEAKKQGYKKFDKNEAANRLYKTAELQVKWYLVKNAIQKQENISISDEELTELAAKDAEKTGIPVDKLVNYYKSSNYSDRFLDQKLFDFLKDKNNIKRVEPDKLKSALADKGEVNE
ncbi:MAG: trigger factor [Ignavibacteriaceae bacterium]